MASSIRVFPCVDDWGFDRHGGGRGGAQSSWILNPGAATYLRETWLTLVVYAGVIVIVVANRGEEWDDELRNAAKFGTIAGFGDVVGIALEHVASTSTWVPAVTIAAMLVIFALWALRERARPEICTTSLRARWRR